MNNCKNCGNAIFDNKMGEYKCYLKQRTCAPSEVRMGCSDWSEKRAVKTETKEVRVDGATFTPNVSEDGVISWTNDQNLENPTPVNIKGPKGDTPVKGEDYFTPEDVESLERHFIPVGEQDFGVDNTISAKGFFVQSIDLVNCELVLSRDQKSEDNDKLYPQWMIDDFLSMKSGTWYGYFAQITSMSGPKIGFRLLDETNFKKDFSFNKKPVDVDDHCIFAMYTTKDSYGRDVYNTRPGEVEFANYAHSFGYNSEVGAKNGVNFGANNKIGPAGGPAFIAGSGNHTTASNVFAVNFVNHVHADNSFVGGMRNTIHRVKGSGANFVVGYMQELWGNVCAMFGYKNKILTHNTKGEEVWYTTVAGLGLNARGSGQFVCGQYNEDDGTPDWQGKADQNSYFVVGGGNSITDRKTAFRIRKGSKTANPMVDVCKNKIINLADGVAATDACTVGQLNALLKRVQELEAQVAALSAK